MTVPSRGALKSSLNTCPRIKLKTKGHHSAENGQVGTRGASIQVRVGGNDRQRTEMTLRISDVILESIAMTVEGEGEVLREARRVSRKATVKQPSAALLRHQQYHHAQLMRLRIAGVPVNDLCQRKGVSLHAPPPRGLVAPGPGEHDKAAPDGEEDDGDGDREIMDDLPTCGEDDDGGKRRRTRPRGWRGGGRRR